MKRTFMSVVLVFIVLLYHSLSHAAINQYTGNWRNVDPNTRGITTLTITGSSNALRMHAWGKCHPQDCDWGEVNAYAYAPDVSSPLEPTAQAVSAVFTTGFSQMLVIVTPAGNNAIRAQVYTRYTDGSGRSNYTGTFDLKRELRLMPMRPMRPMPGQIPMNPAPPAAVQEDCIGFNPATAEVRNINGRWTIVEGNPMSFNINFGFNFGDKKMEALQALKIIKYYRMNQSCFVGRPDPSFQYLLVNGMAPQGSMPGEDCVSFNPNTIEVKNIGGSWKIVDGSSWIFDFGDKENEARAAYAIIRKYGFTRSCYVGRPDPSFRYLRK